MNDVVSLGVGSVAGAVASELLKVVIEEAKNVLAFKSVYKELASTMEDLLPLIIQIEMLQGAEELKKFKDIINEALELVRKCSKVKRWNLPLKARCTRKAIEIDKKMLKFCQIQIQFILLRNQRVDMMSGRRLAQSAGMSRAKSAGTLSVDTMKAFRSHLQGINKKLDVLSNSPLVCSDFCSVPKIDKVLFGLDLPLLEVKKKLLDDDDDDPLVSLVVSAPPGCGKTTLVTQLCHDDEIREKFEHIFFSVMSSAPNFRTLVQNLLLHNGYEALKFEDDSQAIVGLRKLIEELSEEGPILLVLDDVRHGAESLLQKFQINILNFKILVTSRFDFPSFGPIYHLKPLGDEDAKSLLVEQASLRFHMPLDKNEDLLQKILKRCYYGFPLLIEVIGVQLYGKTIKWHSGQVESWTEEETILDNPQPTVLECLQPCLNMLEHNVLNPDLKDCFLDMGSFLEEQKIDTWNTSMSWLYLIYLNLFLSGMLFLWQHCFFAPSCDIPFDELVYLLTRRTEHERDNWRKLLRKRENELDRYNWIKLIPLWKNELENDNWLKLIPPREDEHKYGFYNDFLVTQHSILRELAICQSKSEEHQQRKRLNLDIKEDKFPDWCLDLLQPISARLLSISTDDLFSSNWVEMDCPDVEALVLNLSSSNYALPNFIATMKKLKVVIVINHGIAPAKLTNLSCLSSLPNLKRIRFEKISISWLDILLSRLGSLEKLSLFMCSLGEVFYDIEEIAIPEALPSLQEIDIDCCYDLDELPDWVSEVVSLKKLSITNCNKLSVLPKAIGNLSSLQVLRLSYCTNLSELPETTVRLSNLQFLDISVCLELKKLPLEIGKLQKLENIWMRMCSGCELPDSVRNLENLEVKCDGETALLWRRFQPSMTNLRVVEIRI